MIAILAATADVTAHAVLRWLRAWGYEVVLIDDEDPVVELSVVLDAETEDAILRTGSGRALRLSAIDAFWYRRGELALGSALVGDAADERAAARMREWAALREFFMERLAAKPSLGSWAAELRCSKLTQLAAARAVGLAIPETIVSSARAQLEARVDRWGAAIHKGLASGVRAEEEAGEVLATATRPLELRALARAPERLFPRLAQERVDKRIELRVLFLCGELWAMAMLPRRSAAAAVDVRLGDLDADYRLVPYALPEAVAERLRRLMARLGLDTGSIDLIVDRGGRHVFLEVNPSGQLDWLARALAAPIERRIAERLAGLAGPPLRGAAPAKAPRTRPPAAFAAAAADVDAPHRFAWSFGQRVLVRPLDKPILRRFPGAASPRSPTRETAEVPGDPESASRAEEGGAAVLAANVALVDGVGGPLLYDLQRGRALRPSPALAERLRSSAGTGALRGVEEVAPASALGRGLAAAEAAGLVVRVDDPGRFPQRTPRIDTPALITNVVVDVDADSTHDFAAIFAEVAELGCEHGLVRVARDAPLALLDRLHAAIAGGPPLSLEWWIERRDEVTPAALRERVARSPRLTAVVVFGAREAEAGEWLRTRSGVGNVVATVERLDLDAAPTADPAGMLVRDGLFIESQRHHPLFHGKLAIDRRGLLRNAPHLERDFGRFGARPLAEVVRSPDFTALGAVHRGRILDCRACPLRYACMDGRAPVVDSRGVARLESPCAHGPDVAAERLAHAASAAASRQTTPALTGPTSTGQTDAARSGP
ncbi:MAG: hypothetical protein R3A79_02220 [Nannocystaceae bacterium]